MTRTYRIYGHGDKSEAGFPDEAAIKRYIGGGIFSRYDGRYRYRKLPPADVIVLSREGYAYGHFEVDGYDDDVSSDDLEGYLGSARV